MQDHLKHGSIHEAARQNDVDAIKAFVQNGHDVMEPDRHGNSALAWAIRHRQSDAVRCLLSLGSDPNERCANQPLLCHAYYVNDYDIIQQLVLAGADIDAKDSHGKSLRQVLSSEMGDLGKIIDQSNLNAEEPERKPLVKEDPSNRDSNDIKQIVEREVQILQSADFKRDILTMRDAIGDLKLDSVPENEYVKHMQLIHAQLLGAWVTKLYGGGLDKMLNDSLNWMKRIQYADEAKRLFVKDIDPDENIYTAYSRAFGSSPTDSLTVMVSVFEKLLIRSDLGANARSMFHAHISTVYMSYYEIVARACGIDIMEDSPKRFSTPSETSCAPRVGQPAAGCLIPLLFMASSGSILVGITALLYSNIVS